MKRKIDEKGERPENVCDKEVISRKQAIKKTGYMALSVATAMILLNNPTKASQASPAPLPIW